MNTLRALGLLGALLLSACGGADLDQDQPSALPPPGNVEVRGDDASVVVSWDAVASEGVAGYNVYADGRQANPAVIRDGPGTRRSGRLHYTVGGLTNGDVYAFAVSAVSASGQESAPSDTRRIRPSAGAGKPDLVVDLAGVSRAEAGEDIGALLVETIGNIGSAPTSAGFVHIDIRLSTDEEIPDGLGVPSDSFFEDVLLRGGRDQLHGDLAAGASATLPTGDVELLPDDVAPGEYFLCARVDPDDRVDELDETNNTTCIPLEIVHLCPDPVVFADASLERAVRNAAGSTRLADVEALIGLDASEEGVRSLEGIECLRNLQVLNLDKNDVVDLAPLGTLPRLKRLSIIDNDVSDVSALAGHSELIQLYIGLNPVSDISTLHRLVKLKYLLLSRTGVTDLSVLRNFPDLGYLTIDNNGISDISALAGLTRLKSLQARSNAISDLSPLAGKTSLVGLDLGDNVITNVDALKNLTGLKRLYLFANSIVDPSPLGNLESLEYLHMMSTTTRNIDFVSGLRRLEVLGLLDNDVVSLDPLEGLTALEILNVASNRVRDLSPLAGVPNLRILTAYANEIRGLDGLASLPLERVHLGINYVSDLGPLVGNPNIGAGDSVTVTTNCLAPSGDDGADIAALSARLGAGFRSAGNPRPDGGCAP